eukprot:1651130-Rhodomonas_salina.1
MLSTQPLRPLPPLTNSLPYLACSACTPAPPRESSSVGSLRHSVSQTKVPHSSVPRSHCGSRPGPLPRANPGGISVGVRHEAPNVP